jgi:hypothetical protein
MKINRHTQKEESPYDVSFEPFHIFHRPNKNYIINLTRNRPNCIF